VRLIVVAFGCLCNRFVLKNVKFVFSQMLNN